MIAAAMILVTTVAAAGWACDRPWPNLTLFLPLRLAKDNENYARREEWENIFLKSLASFWPLQQSRTSLSVIVDAEARNFSSYAVAMATIARYQHHFHSPIRLSVNSIRADDYRGDGHIRQ